MRNAHTARVTTRTRRAHQGTLGSAQNCGGGHSAAYKGCPVYLKYQTTINNKNLQLTNNYLNNMSTTISALI
ncbi:hypothetical protein DPMN_020252 [Dreissena polymorpha]|uniref:Uncharacterized protein n=1 Tax=Dreissena polymorpha TaxID=45954 RepID=A0A9D4NLU0_DREPO|nr:hypothetical protein DPMN_020252 [Dreissena polymorpha]